MNWPWISRKEHERLLREKEFSVQLRTGWVREDSRRELDILHAALAAMRKQLWSPSLERNEVPYVVVETPRACENLPGKVLFVDMPGYGWSVYLDSLMMLCKGDPADHVADDFARGWDKVRDEAIQLVRDAVKKELGRD